MRRFLLLGFIFFALQEWACAQDEKVPSNVSELVDLLKLHDSVPGLGYRVLVQEEPDPPHLRSFTWTKTDSGWMSNANGSFGLLNELVPDSSRRLYFTVFSKPVPDEAALAYLAKSLEKGDLVLHQEEPQADWVSQALQLPYAPVYRDWFVGRADLKIVVITGIILLFFVFSVGMFVLMLIVKSQKNRKTSLEAEYDQLIVEPLTNLLFEKDLEEIGLMTAEDLEPYFPRHLVHNPIYREVLIDRIIGLNKKMKGEFKEKLKTLYHRLGLAKVSVDKIKGSQWHIVADGLVEINEMDLHDHLQEVRRLTDSSNFQVRSLAVAAMLNLSEKSDLSFLRDQSYPLSNWQQMNYLRIIKFTSQQRPVKIEMLFDSKNQSVRIFGYKLVRILGRVDLLEKLSSTTSGLNDDEKAELVKTYHELGAHMEIDFINQCLESNNTNLLTQAVKAVRVLGDDRSLEILARRVVESMEFRLKLQMMRSVYELDKLRFEQLISAHNTSDPRFGEIRDHILDTRLSHV